MQKSHLTYPWQVILLLAIFWFNYTASSAQTPDNWWTEITKEHRIHSKDSLIIAKYIFFSDSIVESSDYIFFGLPEAITKTNDGYYIYQADSALYTKTDSTFTFHHGLSVGYAKIDSVYHPISISEFGMIKDIVPKNLGIQTITAHGFGWIDKKYFEKFNFTITSSKMQE